MSGGFANPIVGGGGGLVYPSIHSPNFSLAGQTGWAIMKNGNAYFFGLVTTIGSQLIFIDSNTYTGSAAYLFAKAAGSTSQQSTLFIVSPTDNPALQAILQLTGESEDGTELPFASLFGFDLTTQEAAGGVPFWLNDQAAAPAVPGGLSGTGLYSAGSYLGLKGNGLLAPVTAIEPGTTITPETWHAIPLASGWSTVAGQPVPSYRLLPDGNVQITGSATHASFSAATALTASGALPAAYRPATIQFVSGCLAADAAIEITTAGLINAEPPAATTSCRFNGTYPVNL